MGEDKTFFAKKVGEIRKSTKVEEKTRFVEGKLEELLEITRKVLSNYEKDLELWEDTPVIRFTKSLQGIEIEVGIRAPLIEYGKSYRIWMRVDGVHMYPSEPVYTGKEQFSWVYRVYHTKGWKEKLKKILMHLVSHEDVSVRICKAAEKLRAKQVEDAVRELSDSQKESILRDWQGGSLWDLVKIASRVDREAGIYILKKFGLLGKT